MGIKLKDLDTKRACNEGAVFVPTHPTTGGPLDMKLTVVGRDSDVYVKTTRKINDKRIKAVGRNPAAARQLIASEAQFAEEVELLASCIQGWEGILDENDQEVPYSHETAVAMLTEFPWLREQLDAFVADRSNFLAG